jgi:hypothetical protein
MWSRIHSSEGFFYRHHTVVVPIAETPEPAACAGPPPVVCRVRKGTTGRAGALTMLSRPPAALPRAPGCRIRIGAGECPLHARRSVSTGYSPPCCGRCRECAACGCAFWRLAVERIFSRRALASLSALAPAIARRATWPFFSRRGCLWPDRVSEQPCAADHAANHVPSPCRRLRETRVTRRPPVPGQFPRSTPSG